MQRFFRLAIVTFSCCFCVAASAATPEPFAPRQDQLPTPPPEGAVVLLAEENAHRFVSMAGEEIDWPLENGALVSVKRPQLNAPNHIVSTLHFRDADIHVEFTLPPKGQGNSGIYLHGNYELQIFNSKDKAKPDHHDMGAIYGFHPPLVNAARPPGEWQVYDIRYLAPRRDAAGQIAEEGSITAWLNGKLVQDNARFGEPRSTYHPFRYGVTPYLEKIGKQQKQTSVGPVFLQDHNSPVRFRNVWIRPLDKEAFFYEGASKSTP